MPVFDGRLGRADYLNDRSDRVIVPAHVAEAIATVRQGLARYDPERLDPAPTGGVRPLTYVREHLPTWQPTPDRILDCGGAWPKGIAYPQHLRPLATIRGTGRPHRHATRTRWSEPARPPTRVVVEAIIYGDGLQHLAMVNRVLPWEQGRRGVNRYQDAIPLAHLEADVDLIPW